MPTPPKATSAVSTARRRSEVKTAAMPSARLRSPSSAANARPRADSRPGSQPVATPRSLSSLQEWVSKTIRVDMDQG